MESSFENEIFLNQTNDFKHLRQLLLPQISLDQILVDSSKFKDQRADFILPLIYEKGSTISDIKDAKGYY
jgi:hypothetical protein